MSITYWELGKEAGEITRNAVLALSVNNKEAGCIVEVMRCQCDESPSHYVDMVGNLYTKEHLGFL